MRFYIKQFLSLAVGLVHFGASAQSILMFVSPEDTYYSEYIVMRRGLEAAGYTVDVRSSAAHDFSIYMVPATTDIEETANTLATSSYSQFQSQFEGQFGAAWDEGDNAMPASLPVNGRIQDVTDFSGFAGLVVVGGTGALYYRVDGDYSNQGTGDRLVSAADVQAAAEKLNALAVEALENGKPVMAQCHGASIPAFWRVPGTASGSDLGTSLLNGSQATGFPDSDTPTTLSGLGVTHKANDRVTVASPSTAFGGANSGKSKIITTRDWYPQTVAHAARTFINILEAYPLQDQLESTVSVLVIHGGSLDESNCSASNRDNDVPCNHGGGDNLPADYEDLLDALEGGSDFQISTANANITGPNLPFDPNSESSVLDYLNNYDVVVFFKHWSTGITDELQQAIEAYADSGGGVVGLHHALYNDQNGKNILVNLFGAQSSPSGWSANLTNYNLVSTNYGHFISTYGVTYTDAYSNPSVWSGNPLSSTANTPNSTLPTLSIYDELYTNFAFESGVEFGRGENQITLLFSNDQTPEGQVHTSGFTRLYNQDGDDLTGRVVYLEVGERRENLNGASVYAQLLRNAVMWAAFAAAPPVNPDDQPGEGPLGFENDAEIVVYPNPASQYVWIRSERRQQVEIIDSRGGLVLTGQTNVKLKIDQLQAGIYFIRVGNTSRRLIRN